MPANPRRAFQVKHTLGRHALLPPPGNGGTMHAKQAGNGGVSGLVRRCVHADHRNHAARGVNKKVAASATNMC
jgi:hypothetical protein